MTGVEREGQADATLAPAMTGRHPALRDAETAQEYLDDRRRTERWPHGLGESLDLHEQLTLALQVWLRGEQARRRFSHGQPGAAPPGPIDLVAALTVVRQLVRAGVDDLEAALIALARDAGVTWEELAPALGQKDRRGAQSYAARQIP